MAAFVSILVAVILCVISLDGGALASSPSTTHHYYADICTASQVVELVFNATSGKYEYWVVVPAVGDQQTDGWNNAFGGGNRLGMDNDNDGKWNDNTSSSFLGGEYDGETKDDGRNNRTDADSYGEDSFSSHRDPSDYYAPKISAGRFRKCTCQRQYYKPSSIGTNITLDETDRQNVTIIQNEMLDVVCPLAADVCAIPLEDGNVATTNIIQCFIPNKKSVDVIRNVWPLMIVWYFCFVSILLCSYRGRHALLYCFGNTCSCLRLNDRLVTRLLRQQDDQRDEYRRRLRRRQQRLRRNGISEDDSLVRDTDIFSRLTFLLRRRLLQDEHGRHIVDHDIVGPSSHPSSDRIGLILPTKVYHRQHNCCSVEAGLVIGFGDDDCDKTLPASLDDDGGDDSDEHDADQYCTICFVEFEDGDRIGDLPCRHLYHVLCLKKWIRRRNACPLCSSPLATEAEPVVAIKTVELIGTLSIGDGASSVAGGG